MQKWLFTIKGAWDQKWPFATFFLALCSTLDFIFGRVLPHKIDDAIPRGIDLIPWYWWIIIWLAFFSLMMIDYATKQRLKVNKQEKEIKELKVPKEAPTNFVFCKSYLEKKAGEADALSKNNNITTHEMGLWYEKLFEGLKMVHKGGTIPDGDISDCMRVITSEIDSYKGYILNRTELQRIMDSCSGQVVLMISYIKPYQLSDFKQSDLMDF